VNSAPVARLFAAALAIAVAGCAADTFAPDAPRFMTAFAVAPYQVFEECAHLAPGDRLDYRFESKAPVSFYLYYRDGIAFVAPVTRDAITEASGVFQVPGAHRYCLQWEAGPQGTLLDYRIRILPGNAAP
jgi:hypothetical protein